MSTRKSTAQAAQIQAPETTAPVKLSSSHEAALNYLLIILQDYNEELTELRGSLFGHSAWFREYTKSNLWATLSGDDKDVAFEHYESLTFLLKVMEEQSDTLFPEGDKSPELTSRNSIIQFA